MATTTIHGLAAITSAVAADELALWRAADGTTRRITWANALGGYLLATGATTGATSQAQTFTNGIVGPTWKPASDSTTAIKVQNAAASADIITINTTSKMIGINTAPQATLHLTTESPPIMIYETFNNTLTGVPILMRAARGTKASPSAVGNNDILGGFSMRGYGATGFAGGARAYIYAAAAEAWTDSAQGTYILFATTTKLSTSGTERMRIIDTGYVGFGTTTPSSILHALESNAATNAVFNMITLSGRSSGTAAAGFGVGIAAQLESSTTNDQDAGRLTWAWATATHASRAAIGKLTAYYTSTEREVITWTATSSGATVLFTSVATTFASDNALSYPTQITIAGTTDGNKKLTVGYNTTSNYGAIQAIHEGTAYSPLSLQPTGGNVGIGTVSPQGILHAHDGSGGFMYVNRSGVGGTVVNVIPDGTGDVTENISYFGWCSNSAGVTFQIADGYQAVSSSTTKTDGANTLTFAVTAGGAFTLQATAGAATWKVCIWAFWR